MRVRGSDGVVRYHDGRGNFTTNPRKPPSDDTPRPRRGRGRRTKGPDDDITPERDGGRVNRQDGGLVTRTMERFRRYMGGQVEEPEGYQTGGTPRPLPVNTNVQTIRPPTSGPMDLDYLRGLRDFYRLDKGTVHADGGPVLSRADGGPVVSGPIVGATGGREDALPVSVRSGSYILPADTVSALGEGNTLKGMEVLSARFGGSVTRPRSAGGTDQDVPILISHGEFVVSPEKVAELGRGDMTAGHRALDAFVKQVRAQNVAALRKLPPPATD